MNLQQKSEAQFFTFLSPAFQHSAGFQHKITSQTSQIHFSHSYASFQQMTDAQRYDSTRKEPETKQFSPAVEDYIDQFLSFEGNDSNLEQLIQSQYSKTQLSPLLSSITPQVPAANYTLDAPTKNSIQTAFLQAAASSDSFRSLSKDYNKNLAGYITKKALRILTSPSYRKRLEKCCRSKNLQVPTILEYCNSRLSSIFGPNSIFQFFSITSQDERALKEVLMALFMRILRRDYTLEILRDGRMLDYEAYVKIKNSHLLYFSQILP